MYKKFFKRLFDLIFSFIALIIFMPIMIILYLIIRLNLGKPVIFKQKRPGMNEKIFTLYKFRTMTNQKDKNGNLLPDEKRLTHLGNFLRHTSLDELPELINILKGDMSIVGPRPLLVEYLPLYSDAQKIRHTVRPGLTGLAQVNGRNSISWEEKFSNDIKYVQNISFLTDIKIIIRTISLVFKQEGISDNDTPTMQKFKGMEKVKCLKK